MSCLLGLSFVLVFSMCEQKVTKGGGASTNYESEVRNVLESGWKVIDKLGDSGPYLNCFKMFSGKASAITAYWVTSGKRDMKRYEATEGEIAILSFQKEDGDIFVVALQKAK